MRAKTLIPQGFAIELTNEQGSGHSFAGWRDLVGGECPNCRKPLLLVLTLERSGTELKKSPLAGEGTVPLLFCWTCGIAESGLIYHVSDRGHEIELLSYGEGVADDDFPYENYPVSFPAKGIVLEPISAQEQAILREINEGGADTLAHFDETHRHLTVPRHQLGGEPYLFDPDLLISCPGCNEAMMHLAVLGDETGSGRGFVDNRYVQTVFHLCSRCWNVGAVQRSE